MPLNRFGASPRRVPRAWLAVVLVLASLGPVVVLTVMALRSTSTVLERETTARAASAAHIAASVVEHELEGLGQLTASYAQRRRLQAAVAGAGTAADAEIDRHLRELVSSDPSLVASFVVARDGRLTHITPDAPEAFGDDVSTQQWWPAAVASRTPHVSDAFFSDFSPDGLSVVVTTVLRDDDGDLLGVLGVVFALNSLRELTADVAAAEGVELSITDRTGALVADRGASPRLPQPSDMPGVREALAGDAGTVQADRDGEPQLIGYAPVDDLGWAVLADVPLTDVRTTVTDLHRSIRGTAVLLAAVLAGMGVALARLGRRHRAAARSADEAAERTADSEQLLRAVLSTANDAYLCVDGDDVVLEWSARAEQLLGWSAEEAVGRRFAELAVPPRLRDAHAHGLRRAAATGTVSGAGHPRETVALHRDGHEFPIEIDVTVLDWHGSRRFPAFLRDITQRRQADETRRRLAAIVETSHDAIYSKQLDGTVTSWNSGAERLYGFRAQDIVGRPIDTIVPDDKRAELRTIMAALARGERVQDLETVRRRADGSRVQVSLSISPLLDEQGRPTGASVNARDISERRRAAQATAEAEARFRSAFDDAPIGMALLSVDGATFGQILRVNTAFMRLTATSASSLVGRTALDLLHPDDAQAELSGLRAVVRGERRLHERESRMTRADGELVWVRATATVVHDDEGAPLYAVLHLQDVTAMRTAVDRLAQQALHDPLTGLANRILLADHATMALARASRSGRSVALLFADLDGFKAVNDRHGHDVGDQLLVTVAQRMSGVVRPSDTIARLGGDEFVVLVEDLDPERSLAELQVQTVVQRLEQLIAEPFVLDGAQAAVGVSVGHAFAEAADTPTTLLRRADDAMYGVKAARRRARHTAIPGQATAHESPVDAS